MLGILTHVSYPLNETGYFEEEIMVIRKVYTINNYLICLMGKTKINKTSYNQ